MTAAHAPSDLDHEEFVNELEKVELPPVGDLSAYHSGFDDLDAGLALDQESPDVDTDEWTARRPVFDEDDLATAAHTSAERVVLAVAGFLFLMSVGAGAAALVFHDRVAQILR